MDLLNRSLLNTAGLPVSENWQASVNIGVAGMRSYGSDIYVCGSYLGNIQLCKLNSSGERIWGNTETYSISGSSFNLVAVGVAANSTGVFVIATTAFFPSTLLKYDHNGNFLFAINYTYDFFATRLTCIEANESGVYVGGFRNTRAFAMKLDNSGGIVWQKRYEFSTSDAIYGVGLDANDSSSVYFCGQMQNTGLSKTTGTILQVNESNGSVIGSRQVIGSGNVRLVSVHAETTGSGLASSICGFDELSGKRRGIHISFFGTSAYMYEHATDNVDFVSTKHTRYVTGFSITSPSPVVLWSRGTTNAYLTVGRFITPFVNPFFKGKQFSASHTPVICEIDPIPAIIYSAYRTNSDRGLVMRTNIANMLWDDVASTWGPTTVSDFQEQPSFPVAVANQSVSTTVTDISIATSTGSVSNRVSLTASNFNYSNKAV